MSPPTSDNNQHIYNELSRLIDAGLIASGADKNIKIAELYEFIAVKVSDTDFFACYPQYYTAMYENMERLQCELDEKPLTLTVKNTASRIRIRKAFSWFKAKCPPTP